MNEPVVNLPLLRMCVDWAEAEAAKPEREREWDQSAWRKVRDCGTTYCIAGYVCQVSGAKWPDGEIWDDIWLAGVVGTPASVAQELLGLTYDEQCDLFVGGNTIEDVRRVAAGIAERAGERL